MGFYSVRRVETAKVTRTPPPDSVAVSEGGAQLLFDGVLTLALERRECVLRGRERKLTVPSRQIDHGCCLQSCALVQACGAFVGRRRPLVRADPAGKPLVAHWLHTSSMRAGARKGE